MEKDAAHEVATRIIDSLPGLENVDAYTLIQLRSAIARELRVAYGEGQIFGQQEIIAIYKDK